MTDTLVVGAGPAGLALALGLSCHGLDGGLEVIDPSGSWLSAWDRRFAAQDIPHLRSPSVHHPHPEPFALLRFADGHGLVPSGGTQLPTTEVFSRFVNDAIDTAGLRDRVTPLAAVGMEVDAAGRPTVTLSDGTQRRPDRLLLATNSRHPLVPGPFRDLAPLPARTSDATGPGGAGCAVVFGEAADLVDTPEGGRVVVLGGGLSAAHLAIGAARRGAQVTMLMRRRLMVRRFDTHPSWLGPKKRRPFEREPDPHVRRRMIENARGGGSVPHRFRRTLESLQEQGCLDLRERCQPVGVDQGPDGGLRITCDDGTVLNADTVWLATGGGIDVARDPLLTDLRERHPARIVDGLPDLDPDLCWPGTRVHLAGFAAALALGPTAGNLIGHRRAAQRIVGRLRGLDPAQQDRIATGAGACPSPAAGSHPAAPGSRRAVPGSRPAAPGSRPAAPRGRR